MHRVPLRPASGAARLAAAVVAAAGALAAQGPPGYYQAVDTSSAAALRATLHQVIDDHQRFPYTAGTTDTWDILNLADEDAQNQSRILDVYRNASYAKISGGVGAYNREHGWPKSYGFPNDGPDVYPYTDCHMLWLSDAGYNTARSNKPFVQADQFANEQPTLATNGAGGGAGVYPGNSNWTDGAFTTGRWETWIDRRGDLARALFYADVRYEGGNHGVTNAWEPNLILTDNRNLVSASNTGNNEQVAYMGLLSTLLQWHDADPVDAKERRRNDVVHGFQGNRNPFVDHPEWVACLWGNQCGDTTPPAPPTGLFAQSGDGRAVLEWNDNIEPDLLGYHVLRAATFGGPRTQITATPLTASAFTDTGLANGQAVYYAVVAVDTSANVSASGHEVRAVPMRQPNVWINELHYDNAGADVFEFVEVCGRAGTNLGGFTLIAYDGTTGTIYATRSLAGVLQDQRSGFGALMFRMPLQDGAPDGLALIDPLGRTAQLLSYEGVFTAVGGPAAGLVSLPIPTSESAATPVGRSLQLQGFGDSYDDFVWSPPIGDTPGRPNLGQHFGDR